MRYVALLLVASMFVAMGAAQPEDSPGANPGVDRQGIDRPDVVNGEVNRSEEVNESEEADEPREGDRNRARRGAAASFDARLQTAISTLEALTEIAPSEEAQTGLEKALTTLREVQNSTDTASLGPEERPSRDREGNTDRERDRDRNRTENSTKQRGPPANVGQGNRDLPENAGPRGNRGPSGNSNRPGFVQSLLKGIFG